MSRVTDHRRRREAALALVAVGVVLLALVSAAGTSAMGIGQGWAGGIWSPPELQQPVCTPDEAAMEPPPPHCPQEIRTSEETGTFAGVGFGVLILVVLALSVFSVVVTIAGLEFNVRRQIRAGGSNATPVDAMRDAPQAGATMRRATRRALDELRRSAGGDPSDVVVAAWLALERAATEAGSARAAHQTSAEFVATVLARHEVDTMALDQLRALYVRARFGTGNVVTAADVDLAAGALETLVDDLAGSAV